MDFNLTSEQQQFRESVLRFSKKELEKNALRRAHAPEYPFDVAKLMAKQGLLGITIAEADGGQGGSLMDEMDAPDGRIGFLKPVVRLSQTPPRWARPPVPLGTHPPAWPSP